MRALGRRGDRAAALVEFALVLPVFAILLLGTVSGGFLLNQRMQITHGVREGARYAATIPPEQAWTSGTWAQNVRDMVVERSAGDLQAAQVCVALVVNTSASSTVVYSADGFPATLFSTNAGQPCYGETYDLYTSTDDGRRVQVRASRPGDLQLGLTEIPVTVRASATARSETS